MFILSQKNTVVWPVEWSEPKAGGSFEQHRFSAEYRILPQSRIDQIVARAKAAARGELSEAEAAALDQELLDEVFVTWSQVKNPDKSEFEDTPANRALLLDLPGMRSTLVAGYFQTLEGGPERKNSKPQRTTG